MFSVFIEPPHKFFEIVFAQLNRCNPSRSSLLPFLHDINVYHYLFFYFSERCVPTGGRQETTDGVHQIPGSGAGKRVPFQQVPYPEAKDRDRSFVGAVRAADQNMVPEPADEVQEGQPFAQHEKRAPEKRERTAGRQKVPSQKQQQQQ